MTSTKTRKIRSAVSILLLIGMLVSLLPLSVFAEETDPIALTAGEISYGFAEAGTECLSSDPSVVWVDANGDLRAMKAGSATVTVDGEERTVTVSPYTDGSEVVGQLKILARFNDSMQFYDGHVYLLFTSYKDGVTVTVPDLYAGYEISDLYYHDVRNDVSAGSNHTGSDADKYFTQIEGMDSVTLDRGEIVTIGMYRGFDLTVPQAALGTIAGSTLFKQASAELKTYIIEKIFSLFGGGKDRENNLSKFVDELREKGLDYTALLDGVVSGGVCFNRELYNQKVEWDQFENATYELDVTENQLARLTEALGGNLNKFSILKNSCATVALRAWNNAVGTRDGEDTAYKLDPTGEGLFALIDAPKTVKSEITAKLPGYYLNKPDSTAEQAEPNAGFYDESGWVYVSAPEVLDPPAADKNKGLRVFVTGQPYDSETSVYYKNETGGRVDVDLSAYTELPAGTEIYVKAAVSEYNTDQILGDVTLNGVSVLSAYDEQEQAYKFVMPEGLAIVSVVYRNAKIDNVSGRDYYVQVPVGAELNVSDYARLTIDGADSDDVVWDVDYEYPEGQVVSFKDESKKLLVATGAGVADIRVHSRGNENVAAYFTLEVYDESADLVKVTFNTTELGNYSLAGQREDDEFTIPFSGYMVPRGTVLSAQVLLYQPAVVSSATINGEPIEDLNAIRIDDDSEIYLDFRAAKIAGLPDVIRLAGADDTYQLNATVKYTDLKYSLQAVNDPSVTYECTDENVSIDENGLLTVTGEIGEEGKCVVIHAVAGSSFGTVCRDVKVVIGDYESERIVGRLTISARPVTKDEPTPHTALTFTTYEDVDLDVSFYHYYKPGDAYKAMMADYRDDPEKYPCDPALYSEELDIGDRESYFEEVSGGVNAPAQTISLKAGEGITVSYYAYDENVDTVIKAFANGTIASSPEAGALIEQLQKYLSGEQIDGSVAFDSLLQVVTQVIMYSRLLGSNPADGRAEGGRDVNREIYNQFRQNDSQLPNNFYTVELTAQEFAVLAEDLADPANNYYTLFNKNCASGCVDLWNKVLSDRPSLQFKGNYTGLGAEPVSVYVDLALLRANTGVKFDGEGEGGGTDFVPHVAPANEDEGFLPGDVNRDGKVNAKDVIAIMKHIIGNELPVFDEKAADMNGDGKINAKDVTKLMKTLVDAE